MNGVAATQAEERTITKPPEWAVFMVTAALKCASDEKLPTTYASHDEAKYSILKSLNWFEAHDEYEWPSFIGYNYDFSQVMRLRRALIQDIFNALEKAGNISISIPGTPDSITGRRVRSYGARRLTNNRKRLCKREADVDDAVSEASDGGRQEDAFLMDVATELFSRSKLDVHNRQGKDAVELANMIHDDLVDVWTQPRHTGGEDRGMLQQKADVWERHRRGQPRPSQREANATPRANLGSHTSPRTVPRVGFEPASTNAGGANSVGIWAVTNTMS